VCVSPLPFPPFMAYPHTHQQACTCPCMIVCTRRRCDSTHLTASSPPHKYNTACSGPWGHPQQLLTTTAAHSPTAASQTAQTNWSFANAHRLIQLAHRSAVPAPAHHDAGHSDTPHGGGCWVHAAAARPGEAPQVTSYDTARTWLRPQGTLGPQPPHAAPPSCRAPAVLLPAAQPDVHLQV
jgi:hypothetical protein